MVLMPSGQGSPARSVAARLDIPVIDLKTRRWKKEIARGVDARVERRPKIHNRNVGRRAGAGGQCGAISADGTCAPLWCTRGISNAAVFLQLEDSTRWHVPLGPSAVALLSDGNDGIDEFLDVLTPRPMVRYVDAYRGFARYLRERGRSDTAFLQLGDDEFIDGVSRGGSWLVRRNKSKANDVERHRGQ